MLVKYYLSDNIKTLFEDFAFGLRNIWAGPVGISWANLQKKNPKQLSFKTKIIISKIRPRETFIQPKEAKNPQKISLLLQTKPSKSISKIPSEFSTKQKKFPSLETFK